MKKILVIAIVCLLGSFAAAAQTVKVNGTIVDEQNRPVEFVKSMIRPIFVSFWWRNVAI